MRTNQTLRGQDQEESRFTVAITKPKFQNLIHATLKDPNRARRYVAAITSSVANNPGLQRCTPFSVLTTSLLGEALNLSPSPQMGQYYLVPYKQKAKVDRVTGELISPECTVAQFQLGYKGYVQLALRSGAYRHLNVTPVLQGELALVNPLFEDYDYRPILDEEARAETPTVGYIAAFELMDGFRKVLYWSRERMERHADRYSPAFSLEDYRKLQNGLVQKKDMWKFSSFWYTEFDAMACKTMLRQIISKWGPMSIEMERAFTADEHTLQADGTPDQTGQEEEETRPEPREAPGPDNLQESPPANGDKPGADAVPDLPEGLFGAAGK